jgi:hypothetical protein
MISFERSALSGKVFFLTAIIALFFLFESWAPFLHLLLEASFSFAECRISFLIHFVGMLSRLFLKVDILIVSLIFLGPFFKIIVEARDCRD